MPDKGRGDEEVGEGRGGEEESNCLFFVQAWPDSTFFRSSGRRRRGGRLRLWVPRPKEEEEGGRRGGGGRVSVLFLSIIPASSDCAAYLDSFSSLQGCEDTSPEGEEGQGFRERPALGRCFRYTAGGVEQPGQQPPAQPPA